MRTADKRGSVKRIGRPVSDILIAMTDSTENRRRHAYGRTREQVLADAQPSPEPIEGLTGEERDAFLAAIAEA